MIEKPKRPKQPRNQERQPPRSLQELIERYDLDNIKIYDFLDELVELINTREETVDTNINGINGDITNLNNNVTNLSNSKLSKSGDTMTGALTLSKTSYNYSGGTIPGTKGASSSTIPNLINELRYTNGQMGSFELKTAYTLSNITIAIGWYNYLYIPHRTGGLDGGSTGGDNGNYGNLMLIGMTLNCPIYVIRYSSSQIANLQKFMPG